MRIVVPVTPKNLEEAKSIDLSRFNGADIVEWRADFLEKDDILKVAPAIFEKFSGYELIFTLRTRGEGGNISLEGEDYIWIIKEVSSLYRPHYVDFGYFSYKRFFEKVSSFSNLVLSYHNLQDTPENLMEIISEMTSLTPCVVRVSVTPKSEQDVLDLMNYTRGFKTLNPEQSYVTIAMGELGKISRIVGDLTGSCWTFASLEESVTPGEIPLTKMKRIRELLNEN